MVNRRMALFQPLARYFFFSSFSAKGRIYAKRISIQSTYFSNREISCNLQNKVLI